MKIFPNGTVQLYKNISLDPSYSKTFFFENEVEQNLFFSGSGSVSGSVTPVLTVNNVSYQREKRNTIRLESYMTPVFNCNYMRFKNTDNVGNTFPNKWYYAFILSLEYVNNSTIEIVYQIDVMQTWLPMVGNNTNDYELGNCLVLRNHSQTDEIGDNLQPENFGCGESTFANNNFYTPEIAKYYSDDDETYYFNDEWNVVFVLQNAGLLKMLDWIMDKLSNLKSSMLCYGTLLSGVYQGLAFMSYPINIDTIDDIDNIIRESDIATLGGLITVFMCPSFCEPAYKPIKLQNETDDEYQQRVKDHFYQNKRNKTTNLIVENLQVEHEYIQSPTTFNGYTPINNKLFTFPYNYIYASNNRGQNRLFRYEYFDNRHVTFAAEGGFSVQPSMIMYPTNYKNQQKNYEEKLLIESFATCGYESTNLVDWLAKAAMMSIGSNENVERNGYSSQTFVGKKIYTANDSTISSDSNSNVSTGVGSISSHSSNRMREGKTIRENWDLINGSVKDAVKTIHTVDSESAKESISNQFEVPTPLLANPFHVSNGNILLGSQNVQTFTIYQMQVIREFAQKIDDFFSRYGYPINDVTKPKINVRPKFTYIQTKGCCMINNNIPASVEAEICEIFDNGITFWKDKTEVDQYRYALYEANKPSGGEG